jgi:hypothetical protein
VCYGRAPKSELARPLEHTKSFNLENLQTGNFRQHSQQQVMGIVL